MKIKIAFFLFLLLVISCANKEENTVKWGFIAPLTGTAVIYGIPGINAAQIAVEEINAAGGVLGKKLELVVEDGKCEGGAAVTAAKKMIDIDKIKIMLGGHCSTETLAILPVVQEANIFLLASTTSSPIFTGRYKYGLRTTASAGIYAKAQAEVAWKKGYRTVAVLEEQRDFPKGVVDAFSERFKELGGKILATETFAPGNTDFRTELLKLKNTNADALLVSTNGPDSTGLIFKQIKELGIELPVMGNSVTINPTTWKVSEETMPPTAWAVTQHVEPDASEKTKHFYEEYTKKYGELPVDLSYVAESYDAVHLLTEFVTKCSGYDNECVRNEFLSTKNRVVASGTVTYGEDGDPVHKVAIIRVIAGKTIYEPIEEQI